MTDSIFCDPLWDAIPFHCRAGLIRYMEDHCPVGSFLAAVLSNDLMDAATRADGENIKAFRDYALWLIRFAPRESYGSRANYKAWIKQEAPNAKPG